MVGFARPSESLVVSFGGVAWDRASRSKIQRQLAGSAPVRTRTLGNVPSRCPPTTPLSYSRKVPMGRYSKVANGGLLLLHYDEMT